MRIAPTLWAEEATPGEWPALERDARCDVLVIGAGLAGLAVAGELQARGADVLVVDVDAPGAGASTRNAGFVLISHPWEHAAMRARIGVEATRAMLAIARRTHARIEADHGARVGHRRCGSLMLPLATDAEEQKALVDAAALLGEDGVATSFVDPPMTENRTWCSARRARSSRSFMSACLSRVLRERLHLLEPLDSLGRSLRLRAPQEIHVDVAREQLAQDVEARAFHAFVIAHALGFSRGRAHTTSL